MPTVDRVLVTTRAWVVTVVVYVASIVVASLVVQAVDLGPALSALVWIALVAVGPTVLALRFGLPPLPPLVGLVGVYYVAVALASNSYDTPRWNFSHLRDGLMVLLIQAFAAVCAAAAARFSGRYIPPTRMR